MDRRTENRKRKSSMDAWELGEERSGCISKLSEQTPPSYPDNRIDFQTNVSSHKRVGLHDPNTIDCVRPPVTTCCSPPSRKRSNSSIEQLLTTNLEEFNRTAVNKENSSTFPPNMLVQQNDCLRCPSTSFNVVSMDVPATGCNEHSSSKDTSANSKRPISLLRAIGNQPSQLTSFALFTYHSTMWFWNGMFTVPFTIAGTNVFSLTFVLLIVGIYGGNLFGLNH